MAGFNKEVTKRTTELKTGIHLVSIIDAWILKGPDKKPKLTKDGEMGIVIKYADGHNHIFEQIYYTSGIRERYFKEMCNAAGIKKTDKFRAESRGKRLWIYIREVYDVDGDEVVTNDITGEPMINYYVFKTSFVANIDNKPAMKGDPGRNQGVASEDFVGSRQVIGSKKTLEERAHDAISKENDFPDELEESVVKSSKEAEAQAYSKMQPNESFTEQVEPKAEPYKEDEIDFDDF